MYKICAITTIQGTMEWFVVDSMQLLSENGYDVTLICNMDRSFMKKHSSYAKCIRVPMARGTSVSNLITTTMKMIKIFRKEKFDVLYYTSPNASLSAAFAGKLCGVKKRIYNQWGIRYITMQGWKRKVFKLIEKLTCIMSTHIREASPMNMQLAINEGLCKKEKIKVRGIGGTTGVELAACDSFDRQDERTRLRKEYGIPDDAFVYGYVGRINSDKGINELIEAFEKVKAMKDNCWLLLVGMLDDANPISDNNLKTAKTDARIVLTGNVPSDMVYRYMSMFDVLTHPTYREGFGKVLQEAMGMRLPIITTDVIGPKEVVEDGISGILIRDHDANALKKQMINLYDNPELREQLAINGRKRAEEYFDRPIMLRNILKDTDAIMSE